MKFSKFGKALLMSALSAGVTLSVTSCVQSYSVGFLYVTGTVSSQSTGNGIVSGFKIDHNTGKLTPINGLPVSSGGANPVRALLLGGSRFLYVLNRGVNASGGSICTTDDPCKNSNITQFAVGANGVLTPQQTFFTKGVNPFRMIADGGGSYIYVLDHDSPGSPSNPICAAALGKDTGNLPITACGDITVFHVDSTTGRLSLIVDQQATATLGTTVPYFPVPANPVDFVLHGSNVLTLNATQLTVDATTAAYTGGATVYPYNYNSSTGQLGTTGIQSPGNILNISAGTAIVSGAGFAFVLDNEPPNPNPNNVKSQILPYSVSNGSLVPPNSGPIDDDANQSNPVFLTVESKGKWFYVANQGNPEDHTIALSGIAGYVINSPFLPTEMGGLPIGFGAGAGPMCLVEDPSNQFFYTANFLSQTVTGQVVDQNAGTLTPLSQSSKVPSSYKLAGPPTWCLVDGRTN